MDPTSPPLSRPLLQILILAAGASARMRGADKLLEPVAGLPLLRQTAIRALQTGLPVSVTLPPDRPARRDALAGLALAQVIVPDAAEGMGASLRAGVASLPEGAAVLLLLADLPEITVQDLRQMVAASADQPQMILRGCDAAGEPGHPVLFPADLRSDLLRLSGDAGARQVLRDHAGRLRLVPLPGRHATCDLDTPEDWALWRARAGSGGQ